MFSIPCVSLVTIASERTISIATDCFCVTVVSTGCAFINICKKSNVVYHKNTNIVPSMSQHDFIYLSENLNC